MLSAVTCTGERGWGWGVGMGGSTDRIMTSLKKYRRKMEGEGEREQRFMDWSHVLSVVQLSEQSHRYTERKHNFTRLPERSTRLHPVGAGCWSPSPVFCPLFWGSSSRQGSSVNLYWTKSWYTESTPSLWTCRLCTAYSSDTRNV